MSAMQRGGTASERRDDATFIQRTFAVLRDKGAIGLLRRARAYGLQQSHERLVGRRRARLEQVPTTGGARLERMQLVNGEASTGGHYAPTPHLLTERIFKLLPKPRSAWNFIDIGSGRGRVLTQASQLGFRRVIGIEYARELQESAAANVAAYSNVNVILGNAATMTVPDGPSIFFMFNPFTPSVLMPFLDNVHRQKSNDPLIFVYVKPSHEDVFHAAPWLRRIRRPFPFMLWLALFSPFNVVLYANTQGETAMLSRRGQRL